MYKKLLIFLFIGLIPYIHINHLYANPKKGKKKKSKETELKYQLDEPSFNALINHFEVTNHNTLENLYFDTENFLLRKNGINVRIRTIDNQISIFTVKVKPKKKKGKQFEKEIRVNLNKKSFLHAKEEYECQFKSNTYVTQVLADISLLFKINQDNCTQTEESTSHPAIVLSAILEDLTAEYAEKKPGFDRSMITYRGKNQTIRYAIKIELGGANVNLELDRTTYLNRRYIGFKCDLELKKSDKAVVKREMETILTSLSIPIIPSKAGKTKTTFMLLRNKPEDLKNLFDSRSIFLLEH